MSEPFDYGECSQCGSLTLLDRVDPSVWYEKDYERLRDPPGDAAPSALTRVVGVVGEHLLLPVRAAPARWLPPHPSWVAQLRGFGVGRSSPILDVGCGNGAMLQHLARFGFDDLHGIDPFLPDAATRSGPVRLERHHLADVQERYAAIFFNHSLEHMDDAEEQLVLARERLRPRGVVIVNLPIVGGRAWRRFRDNWAELDAPLHRFLPTPDGMVAMAKRTRMRAVRWHGETPTHVYQTSATIQAGASARTPSREVAGGNERWARAQARHEHGREASHGSFVLVPDGS